MTVNPRLQAAIISSRPRDHVRDGIEALGWGLHVLVEKPLSVDCESGRLLVAAAETAGRVLTVGTEFAYLPAFYQLAEELAGAGKADVSLVWDDIANEERYGAAKVRHEEIGLLHDLLPHAFSILRILIPNGELRVSAAGLSPDGCRGRLEFTDIRGGRHECRFDAAAPARQRVLQVRADSVRASVDFDVHSLITVNDQPRAVDPQLSPMISTLRLELGAFLSQATGVIGAPFTNWDASSLLSVQADMERMLALAD
jgi:predicted dehydrogenase